MFQGTWAVSDSQDECKVSSENRKVGAPFLRSVKGILGVLELADKIQCAGFGGSGRGNFVKGDSSVGLPCAEALQHWSDCALSDGSGCWSYWSSLISRYFCPTGNQRHNRCSKLPLKYPTEMFSDYLLIRSLYFTSLSPEHWVFPGIWAVSLEYLKFIKTSMIWSCIFKLIKL